MNREGGGVSGGYAAFGEAERSMYVSMYAFSREIVGSESDGRGAVSPGEKVKRGKDERSGLLGGIVFVNGEGK